MVKGFVTRPWWYKWLSNEKPRLPLFVTNKVFIIEIVRVTARCDVKIQTKNIFGIDQFSSNEFQIFKLWKFVRYKIFTWREILKIVFQKIDPQLWRHLADHGSGIEVEASTRIAVGRLFYLYLANRLLSEIRRRWKLKLVEF